MNKFIEVNDLCLSYKNQQVIKNISFSLEQGKIYGLIGRNGAGKTSLLSLLASFNQPTAGTIKIDGEVPFENARIMQEVAFIYDRDFKDESSPVKEMFDTLKRYRPNFDEEYAKYLLDRFELPLKKPVNKLSKGKKAALNVTIGLSSRAPITIFDEAYLGMDAPTRTFFYKELLEDQARYPRTFILSTHLVSEMDYLFEEVLIIHRGELVFHDDFETLISRGASITGDFSKVDQFVQGKKKLSEQTLGRTKSVMIYGNLTEEEKEKARSIGLDIGPVNLQDLFIYLTEEGK